MKLPKRKNKDWIRTYLDLVVPRTEAPEHFHYWSAVSTIGGVLRRQVYLDQGHFAWYPNFYIVLVGPPGVVRKSTTIDMGLDRLKSIPDIVLGPDCTSWQQFIQAIENSRVEVDLATPGSDEVLLKPMCAVSLGISELGNFLDPKDYAMVNVLTDLWDCREEFKKETKTQGSNLILNPFVNFIAATTPQWLEMNFRHHFGGWGLSSRIIMLYADKPTRQLAYPRKVWGGKSVEQHMEDSGLLHDLKVMSQLKGGFLMSEEAEDLGTQWYSEHEERKVNLARNPNTSPWVLYYLARKQGHIHKLALVLAASRRNELIITTEDLQEAIDKCNDIEGEISSIFKDAAGSLGKREHPGMMFSVIERQCLQYGKIEEIHLYKFFMREMDYGELQNAVKFLINGKFIVKEVEFNKSWVRLPTEEEKFECKSQMESAV